MSYCCDNKIVDLDICTKEINTGFHMIEKILRREYRKHNLKII